MLLLNPGDSTIVQLARLDALSVETRGTVVVDSVDASGNLLVNLGTVTNATKTFGPYLPGYVRLTARDRRCTYGIAAGSGQISILAQSGVQSVLTGTTTETALASVIVPGGMLGLNGVLRVTALASMTNNANLKSLNIKLGAALLHNIGVTTMDGYHTQVCMRNRGSVSSQVMNGYGGFGNVATPITRAVDTSIDQVLTITGALVVGTDTFRLEGYTVEVLPG